MAPMVLQALLDLLVLLALQVRLVRLDLPGRRGLPEHRVSRAFRETRDRQGLRDRLVLLVTQDQLERRPR